MSTKDEERLAIVHAHSLAAIDASAVGMPLGMWAGRGDYAGFPQEWRDRQGVRALVELDAAITHLATVRDQLAQAVGLEAPQQISVMLIEVNPFTSVHGEPVLSSGYSALPRPWLAALDELLDHPDATTCWRCDASVGFALCGDDTAPRWISTALSREGDGLVAALCESCAPGVPAHPRRHLNAVIPRPKHMR